jgi:hypothetical protein
MDKNIQDYLAYTGGRTTSTVDYSKYFRTPEKVIPKGNPLLKTGLSIGLGTLGGALGSLAGPGGTIAGGALGSGLGTALGRALGGQAVFGQGGTGEIALDTALGGLFSGGVGKLLKGGGEAAKGIAGIGAKEAVGQTAEKLGQSVGVSAGKEATQAALQKAGKITGQQAAEAAQQAVKAGRPQDIFGKAALSLQRAGQKELGFQEAAKLGGRKIGPQEGDTLFNFLVKDIGIKGGEKISPGKALRAVENYQGSILKSLDQSVKDIGYTFSKADAEKIILNARKGYGINVQGGSKVLNTLESNVFNALKDNTFEGVDKARKALDKTINYARKQGSTSPWMEDVANSLRKSIDERLTQISGVNKDIKTLYAKSQKATELLQTAQAKEAAGPGNWFQLGMRAVQAGRAGAGSVPGLQKALKTASTVNTLGGKAVSPTLLSSLGRQTVRAGATPIAASMLGGKPQDTTQADMTGMEATGGMSGMDSMGGMETAGGMTGGTMGDMGQQSQLDAYFQGLALQDLQQTGGKRLSAIKAAYDLFGGGKSQKSISQQNAERKLNQAVNTVGLLQQQFQKAGGGQGFGGYGQALAGALKLPSADAARTYQQNRQGFAALISKSLGESGVLTDQDVKRALANVPDITDTPGVAQAKWNNLMQVLQGGYSNVGSDTRFNF